MSTTHEELADRLRYLKYDYDSMSTSLEDAIDDIADEVKQLQAENEKLREQGERLFDKTLATENAKLRELVRDMWDDVCNAPCCAYCDHSDYDGDKCELQERIRELGVRA